MATASTLLSAIGADEVDQRSFFFLGILLCAGGGAGLFEMAKRWQRWPAGWRKGLGYPFQPESGSYVVMEASGGGGMKGGCAAGEEGV